MSSSTVTRTTPHYSTRRARPRAYIFHLAGVLAELGDPAGARMHYETFLRYWGRSDRPVPEVAVARHLLAEL